MTNNSLDKSVSLTSRGFPRSPSRAWMTMTSVPTGESSITRPAIAPVKIGGVFCTSLIRMRTPTLLRCSPSFKHENTVFNNNYYLINIEGDMLLSKSSSLVCSASQIEHQRHNRKGMNSIHIKPPKWLGV